MANETPSRPPPFMANAILNFHFDYVTPSLIWVLGLHLTTIRQYILNIIQRKFHNDRGQIDGDTLGPIHAESVYKVKFI